MSSQVTEQQLLEALQHVPRECWSEVLQYLHTLEAARSPRAAGVVRTGTDLANSDLIGLWADRTDIDDSLSFARRLREQVQRRTGTGDAP